MPSDVKWNWLDPRTVELYNTDRQGPAAREREIMQGMMQADMRSELQGWDQAEAERRQYADDESRFYGGGRPQTEAAMRKERREQRKQIRMFDKYMKEGGKNLASGFQELVESGAAWVDEGGDVFTAMPGQEEDSESGQRILQAAREWMKMQDYLSKMAGKGATEDELQRLMQQYGR